jgi:hypothetical protein
VPGIGGEPLSPALVVSGRAGCSSVPFRGADPLLSSKPLLQLLYCIYSAGCPRCIEFQIGQARSMARGMTRKSTALARPEAR